MPTPESSLEFMLQRSGAEVRTAGSAAEALEALDDLDPSVIVSDIGMPNADGYSLIRDIRTHPQEIEEAFPPSRSLPSRGARTERARWSKASTFTWPSPSSRSS